MNRMNAHNLHHPMNIYPMIRYIGSFLTPNFVEEILEPFIKFVLDLMTILLLGLSMFTQLVYMILSLNTILNGLKSTVRRFAMAITSPIFATINLDIERRATHTAFTQYILNLVYIKVFYGIKEGLGSDFLSCFACFGSLYVTKALFLARIEFRHAPDSIPYTELAILFLLSIISIYTLVITLSVIPKDDFVRLNYFLLLSYNIDQYYSVVYIFLKQYSSYLINYVGNTEDTPPSIPATIFFSATSTWAFYELESTFLYHCLEIMRNTIYASAHMLYLMHLYYQHHRLLATTMFSDTLLPPLFNSTLPENITSTLLVNITDTLATNLTSTFAANSTTSVAFTPMVWDMFPGTFWTWYYYLLLVHNILYVSEPLKKCLHKLHYDAYIEQHFPTLSKQEQRSISHENCPVCLMPMTMDCVRLSCRHSLHRQCLYRILQMSMASQQTTTTGAVAAARCPMCRADIHVPRNIYTPDGLMGGSGGSGRRGGVFHPLLGGRGGLQGGDMISIQVIIPATTTNTLTNTLPSTTTPNTNTTTNTTLQPVDETNTATTTQPSMTGQPLIPTPTTTAITGVEEATDPFFTAPQRVFLRSAGGRTWDTTTPTGTTTTNTATTNTNTDRVSFRVLPRRMTTNTNTTTQRSTSTPTEFIQMHMIPHSSSSANSNEPITLAELVHLASTAAIQHHQLQEQQRHLQHHQQQQQTQQMQIQDQLSNIQQSPVAAQTGVEMEGIYEDRPDSTETEETDLNDEELNAFIDEILAETTTAVSSESRNIVSPLVDGERHDSIAPAVDIHHEKNESEREGEEQRRVKEEDEDEPPLKKRQTTLMNTSSSTSREELTTIKIENDVGNDSPKKTTHKDSTMKQVVVVNNRHHSSSSPEDKPKESRKSTKRFLGPPYKKQKLRHPQDASTGEIEEDEEEEESEEEEAGVVIENEAVDNP